MDGEETMFEAFEEALANAKTQTAFAKEVGCSQQMISYLLKHRLPLSPKFVLRTEAAFGVSRHRLRPDLYPHDAPAPCHPHNGVVPSGAPIVACDRSAILHHEGSRQ
jgi:DNA-binding transcriptional regulator YdaS (Cro superfamily)